MNKYDFTILHPFITAFCNTIFFIFLLVGVSTASAAQEGRDAYIDVDGYTLHLKIMGEEFHTDSSTTIVLESGGGEDWTQWSDLQPQLVQELNRTVVSYDRFGYGESDLPETEFDIREEVAALHTALEELNLSNSVLLIGQSMGGLMIHNYTTFWPDEVKGLLFLEANTAGSFIALEAMYSQPANPNPQTKAERAFARMVPSLMDTLTVTYQNPLPLNIPTIVISAEQGPFPLERYNRAHKLAHQLLAASVENGKYLIAEGSGHNIPGDRPDLIISSVKELLEE